MFKLEIDKNILTIGLTIKSQVTSECVKLLFHKTKNEAMENQIKCIEQKQSRKIIKCIQICSTMSLWEMVKEK